MPYKPMKLKAYRRWIGKYGWQLVKGSIDWKLLDENGKLIILNILIPHPPGSEVAPISVKKTTQALKLLGKE